VQIGSTFNRLDMIFDSICDNHLY